MSPLYLRLIPLLMGMGFFALMVSSQSLVENLPGFPGKLPFTLETGYIGVGESEEVQLFYYFVESERDPENDALLLWLTGGPGCSSFSGFVYEIGPINFDFANSDGKIPALVLNPYSWTKVANIIFLDQPVGTGFSYAKTPQAYKWSDSGSGSTNYEFLKKWLINHPRYLKNPLYIGGDSYSGITVPLVLNDIYNGIAAGSKPHLNMKGYILGNPLTDSYGDYNGRIPYAHRMGLLSDELYRSVKENCGGDYINVDPDNSLCKDDLERVNKCFEKIYMLHILEPWCDGELVPTLKGSGARFLQSISLHADPCSRDKDMLVSYKWLNLELVKKALHIREATITEWLRCNTTLKEATVYTNDVKSTVDYHKKFTHKDCRALIYSGDHDMGFPHTATEEWIRSLKLYTRSDWRPWFVEGQNAGYTTSYFNANYELTYATVKGGGHTAPGYKPRECLPMIERWLSHNPL